MKILKSTKRTLPTRGVTGTAKVTASSPSKKTSSARTPAKASKATATKKESIERERDEHGITAGTDQSIILAEMVQGGESKHAIIERCNTLFDGKVTTGGKPKPISTIVNQLVHLMAARGYTIESTWKLVPPAPGTVIAPIARKARKASVKKAIAPTEKPGVVRRRTASKPAVSRALPKANRSKASV